MIISLSVSDYLKSIIKNHKISIKWPNDIYIDNGKVAGILISNTIQGELFENAIIGIGLNINQLVFSSDAPNPVSLKMITGKNFHIKKCLNNLCIYIEKRYEQLRNGLTDIINYDYLTSLFWHESFQKYKYDNNIITAKITGISEFGKLILITKEKHTIECDLKEITFIIE